MNGSLAIWYDEVGDRVDGFRPEVELHFNIWKDLPGRADALDIGIQFKEIRTIRSLKIFVPGAVAFDDIEDLSQTLMDSSTLSAVFNAVYHVGAASTIGYDVLNENEERALHILYMPKTHIDLTLIHSVSDCVGTVISVGEDLLHAPQSKIGDHYIRLRITLRGKLKAIFGNRTFPKGVAFIPSFAAIDTVEFRVNERRNFSKHLRLKYPKMLYPRISVLNYFLVTNRKTEMVRSHANFRKMRLLEPGLWDSYLESLGTSNADDLVIYQWREGEVGKVVEDFIALAVFRKGFDNTLAYIAVVLLVGALGSSVSAVLVASFDQLVAVSTFSLKSILPSLLSLIILLVAVWGLAWGVQRLVEKL